MGNDKNYENFKRQMRNEEKETAKKFLALAKKCYKDGNVKVALLAMRGYHRNA